jgi:hypothetical protein
MRVKAKVSQVRGRLADRIKLAKRKPLFYDRGDGVFAAAALVGPVAGVLPGVFAIVAWSKERQVSTNLAVVIMSLYIITMFGTMFGSYIAFGWLDYGLARMGVDRPTRSGVWVGIAAAVLISAFTISARLALAVSLIIILTGTLAFAGLAWLVSLPRISTEPAIESSAAVKQDLVSCVATSGIESGGPILGAYRLTFDEFLTAVGYVTMAQPRFHQKPRLMSALLPRSVGRRSTERAFSGHPHRNEILRFVVDADSISWQAEGCAENTAGWEQVKKVTHTPRGFLLYWTGPAFEWMPFCAFFAEDGPEAFAELAQRHTEYSEMA